MRTTYQLRRPASLDRELANTRFERILGNASQLSLVLIGCAVALVVVDNGEFILAPIFLAIIIGLMCGPLAGWMERRGVPPALSAGVVVLVLIGVLVGAALAFSAPLSAWVARGPQIWEKLKAEVSNFKGVFDSIGAMQEQLKSIFGGGDALTVKVDDGGPITDLAFFAPAALGQVLIFFGGLYFFLAARDGIRIGVLSLCFTRKVRWRTAHVFRDVEHRVSRYLLTITVVNFCLGCLVALAMWALGMPSPLLFGALAFVLNYVPFLGQGAMLVVIFGIALGTRDGLTSALFPVAAYWFLSFIESQVVTPNLLGRTMTINPFLIFLSLTFWLWAWGPVGGLVAVPSVLVLHSMVTHIIPVRGPTHVQRVAARAAAPAAPTPEPAPEPVVAVKTRKPRAPRKAAATPSP